MRYDANQPHRRSIRLANYDYRSPGAYFVTICVHAGECLLSQVVDGRLQLSDWGQIVWACWQAIPTHFPHVELDAFVVMPNHVHGIIILTDRARRRGEASTTIRGETKIQPSSENPPQPGIDARDASPLPAPSAPAPGSLGVIVGNFKSVTTRRINRRRGTPGVPFWQRNYWERVIRNEASLKQIREYIESNPARWIEDHLHPEAGSSPFRSGQP